MRPARVAREPVRHFPEPDLGPVHGRIVEEVILHVVAPHIDVGQIVLPVGDQVDPPPLWRRGVAVAHDILPLVVGPDVVAFPMDGQMIQLLRFGDDLCFLDCLAVAGQDNRESRVFFHHRNGRERGLLVFLDLLVHRVLPVFPEEGRREGDGAPLLFRLRSLGRLALGLLHRRLLAHDPDGIALLFDEFLIPK